MQQCDHKWRIKFVQHQGLADFDCVICGANAEYVESADLAVHSVENQREWMNKDGLEHWQGERQLTLRPIGVSK